MIPKVVINIQVILLLSLHMQSDCLPLRFINTTTFRYDKRWPCGCKALHQAGVQMGKKKTALVTRTINQTIKNKRNVTDSMVLEKIGRKTNLNLRFLMLNEADRPVIIGMITYYPHLQNAQQAREEKTANLIKSFARSNKQHMHFICYLEGKNIKHGFLISINRKKRKKPTMLVYTDQFTKKLNKTVKKYIDWINRYYHARRSAQLDTKVTLTREEIINSLLQMNFSNLGPITIEETEL